MLLAGCSAPVPPAQTAPAQAAAASQAQTVDVASLGRDVDSQTAAALREQPNVVILDVREQDEWDAGHIPGAVHIPMGEVPARIAEIPTDKTVIVQCRSGNRSSQITDFLRGKGMNNVHNLAGGLNAWSAAGLPVEQ
ncbi:MAG: rhodanese-like domain-containing protein [Anaerolineales bacterium]|nr:rhodanese-like domain-containing protein [Anaerolineales bacterium]